MNLSTELAKFHEFIGEKLANGDAGVTPEEALYDWRTSNPLPEELADSTAAIRQSLG